MEFFNKYKYPFIIVFFVIIFGWFYMSSILEGVDESVAQDRVVLDEYLNRMNFIGSLVTKTDLFEGDIYASLTDEFEEDVMKVQIGKTNPFKSF